ncbi:hypothetical protein EGI16_03410 [Chryseobacterium sp. G0240]|uniref:hypothetical protein n=1 Tax=Chryseobacterium sp. G0240 TaxID=2487066 RepID=UPI000F44677C|nr:hypothetical protein [Chryseobacterium sp. G0240]ROI05447.1 hypothetical protein EGI16_03410 [Chryseobacterium sp. G0240]
MEIDIRDYLLEELPFLNAGFTGIFLDSITGKLISYHGEEIGISDKNGAFFYLRENGDQNFRIQNLNAPKMLETNQEYKLILYARNHDIEEVKKCTLNALWNYRLNTVYPISVTSCSTNIGKIIYTEYPKLKAEDRLNILKNLEFGSLLSFDLKITGKFTVNNCKCNICKEC